jgi:hypothetical protein
LTHNLALGLQRLALGLQRRALIKVGVEQDLEIGPQRG